MNAVATPRVPLSAVTPADPYAADPGRTGIRPAYRPQTFVTDAEGQWRPSKLLFGLHEAQGPHTESMRELRSQLILRWFKDGRTTLAVTGGRSGDGCSTIAANLAIVLAQLGERTLLIDANFRNPQQHELFALRPEAGLADLLRGRDVYDEALTAVPSLEHLRVLCAGAIPLNPQELLSRASFIYVLKTMSEKYRSIVIDTPPALAFADVQIVAARAQGCLLVTKRHHTRLMDVEEVKQRLEPTGAQLLGAVINE
ncbi:MAG: polysaccharide biosynthesis tyrosine autokinase [Gammaproteobacteria bacterium]